MLKEEFSLSEVADILGVSKETLRRWDTSGKLVSHRNDENNYRFYRIDQLKNFEQAQFLFKSQWSDETKSCNNTYTVLELFAGAGGMALG
ncbi:MerR family DNA-binding transcriptional regulator, partial [Pseudomonas aeruginosa]